MHISKEEILQSLQKELTLAESTENEEEMKRHITRMTMLCDLLLQTNPSVEVGTVLSKDEEMRIYQEEHTLTDASQPENRKDPYDIFDF